MTISSQQIDALFATLKALLDQIAPLRVQVGTMEDGMAKAQRDYDRHLGELNREADDLAARKAFLEQRLAAPASPDPVLPVPIDDLADHAGVIPPPPLVGPEEESEPDQPAPPAPPEDPRFRRKRVLADHIYYFLESSQDAVMQVINAVLDNEHCDMGDMLELLGWGSIWMARAEWETLENHVTRLDGWRQALEERLAFWHNKLNFLEQDPRYALWQAMAATSGEAWQTFLRDRASEQAAENARLAHEVAVLEAQWQGAM